jgi:hypothetical protein
MHPTRRHFLLAGSAAATGSLLVRSARAGEPPATVGDGFPSQAPEVVQEMVGVSHGNVARVRELLSRQPSLAKAAWDWGFGDWETALGAASHVGNREIAELLLAHGARPDLFTAAMLGWLEVVKQAVAASPGIQRLKGPHSIPLLAHAEAGGARAKPVHDYLISLGDAGERPADRPMAEEELGALLGVYRFGAGPRDRLEVARRTGGGMPGQLTVRREGGTVRNLFHLGERVFQPAGAEKVRLRFSAESPARTLTLVDEGRDRTAVREGA